VGEAVGFGATGELHPSTARDRVDGQAVNCCAVATDREAHLVSFVCCLYCRRSGALCPFSVPVPQVAQSRADSIQIPRNSTLT
jgi:hypothetical protein